jgi:hypothetical protein|nr:MAG TPA: tail sheath protein [Caudoviricetes sp.]
MALGGGYWLKQNKVLPGAYINFVSKNKAFADSVDRGYGTMALDLDWGATGQIVTVTQEVFQKKCQDIFGYDYSHDKMRGLRDLFLHLKTLYVYRLNSDAVQATGTWGKAKYGGVRGNDIAIGITDDVDQEGKFVVTTYLDNKAVDKQSGLSKPTELVDNEYVTFIKSASEFAKVAATKLTGGTNGTEVKASDYQNYIGLIEPYYFNCLGYAGTDATIQELLLSFAKRCREDTGAKFQVIFYNKDKANYEGAISVLNRVTDSGAEPGSLVYWLTGAEASCEINQSCTNMVYDGEYTVDTSYQQYELENAIKAGQLMFHRVIDGASGDVTGDIRLLEDINTFTEFTKSKSVDFSYNQVIRVLDNWAYDVARLFNKTYLGKENNDAIGRSALWADIVKLAEDYQKIRAIKEFDDDDIEMPYEGDTKDSVVCNANINPTVAMQKLYCTTYVN